MKRPVDVLTFTGDEELSSPFRYDIQFTSSDKAIAPESVLMQDGAFSLTVRAGGTVCLFMTRSGCPLTPKLTVPAA